MAKSETIVQKRVPSNRIKFLAEKKGGGGLTRENKNVYIGMAYQKVYKQGRDDIKVEVNIQSPIPALFSH